MNSEQLFTLALGIQSPWYVREISMKPQTGIVGELHIYLDFKPGSLFQIEGLKARVAYDTAERTWQHLNFFQHKCFLHARVPRIKDDTGKPQTVPVPWARPGSGFTLLFEAYAMLLIECEMPVSKAGSVLGVYPNRIWGVFNHWVGKAHSNDDISGIKQVGFDETSTKKGHHYVTVAVDLDQRRVVFATPGKDASTIKTTAGYFGSKGVAPSEIKQLCMDMSPSFISGAMGAFPDAAITFDKFHVVKEVNNAMDELRRLEARQVADLKGTKYTFLKNDSNLTKIQRAQKDMLLDIYPRLGMGYRLKTMFSEFWDMEDAEQAGAFLAYWCDIAKESKIQPFIRVANMVKAHWSGIVNYIKSSLNNGILEGINSKIQLAKKRARGYRNIENFINMIYYTCGRLHYDYPQYSK
jgi:transposase